MSADVLPSEATCNLFENNNSASIINSGYTCRFFNIGEMIHSLRTCSNETKNAFQC